MLSIFVTQPWLGILAAFFAGAIVGSFLNVCIYRIPMEKSVLWPGSRCGNCLQPIRWSDNLPLLSYWLLRGKCRLCGGRFSSRYFWTEFLTAAGFALLFYLEVTLNLRGVGSGRAFAEFNRPDTLIVIWIYHALFFSFLLVATFIDAEYMVIPLSITIPGTLIGILGGVLAPWPWPGTLAAPQAVLEQLSYGGLELRDNELFPLYAGLQPWPAWMPSPEWMPPGSWQMGLANSLLGALAGYLVMRGIRAVFTWALEREAMGLGDADLMVMIGAFLGWQDVFLVLMLGVFLGLFYALSLLLRNKGSELPFGPFLSGGAILAMLLPVWLHGFFQRLFFSPAFMSISLISLAVAAFFMLMFLRMLMLIIGAFGQGKGTT